MLFFAFDCALDLNSTAACDECLSIDERAWRLRQLANGAAENPAYMHSVSRWTRECTAAISRI
jgi:hypothetical protein